MTDTDVEGIKVEEPVYTVGQLAGMLGCSIRTIYRWEKDGTIPAPQRVDRGEVSARLYTQCQVEEIREKVGARIAFTAVVRERRHRRRDPNKPVRVVLVRKKKMRPGILDEFSMDPDWAPMFISAIRVAQKEGCTAVSVKTAGGKTRTFSRKTKKG